jgi:hypothetical protein
MSNSCNVSAEQAATIDIIDSKKVNITQDAVQQYVDLVAGCVQSLSANTSITNRIEQDFKQTAENKQSMLLLVIIIIVVAVIYIVLILSTKGGVRSTVIIIGAVILLCLVILLIVQAIKKPNQDEYKKQVEEKSAESNVVTDKIIAAALKSCDDSKATGYKPTEGFYWTFNGTTEKGPYVPPPVIVNGKLAPRNRTGADERRPAGWQPSAVRQNAERMGVDYYDNETDQLICTRKDLARPSIPDMALRYQGK